MMPSYLFPSGKYMQMMTVLKPIAFDVILCMSQLFDYYFYTVSWNLYLHVLVYTGKAVLYIFFLSGINFFYLISGVFLFRCWYGEYKIQNLWHIYTQMNSRQFKWKGPSKYHNIWYGKVSLFSEQEKTHHSPVFITGWRVLRVMVDHPPIENKGVGYINGNALISYFDILQTTKNERSINNRLNIALQRIHNNLIAESPVPGAPPVDQSENLVSRSGSLRIRWCQSGS